MTENRTLGDFGNFEDDDEDGGEDDEDGGEATAAKSNLDVTEDVDARTADHEAATPEEPDRPEPATVTYAWSPDGDACGECGEEVETRWRAGEGAEDPDALVCEACKEW